MTKWNEDSYNRCYNLLQKWIFENGKMMLSPEIDSCDFHAMTHMDTGILGMFCDYTGIHGEQLKEILIKGYLSSSVERNC